MLRSKLHAWASVKNTWEGGQSIVFPASWYARLDESDVVRHSRARTLTKLSLSHCPEFETEAGFNYLKRPIDWIWRVWASKAQLKLRQRLHGHRMPTSMHIKQSHWPPVIYPARSCEVFYDLQLESLIGEFAVDYFSRSQPRSVAVHHSWRRKYACAE